MNNTVRILMTMIYLGVAFLAGAGNAQATPVLPSSYDMPNGYGKFVGGLYNYWDANYTGSGEKKVDGARLTGGKGKLTDGIIATESWEWNDASGEPHSQQNDEGTGPYVGWTWGDPTITFHFADLVSIETMTFFVDNPANDRFGNPRGGVTAPLSFTINGQEHKVTKPTPGVGPMALTFGDLDLEFLKDLTVTINRDISDTKFWVFVSEITFDDGKETAPVPEPSSVILLGAGGAACLLWRRRRKVTS